MRELAASGAVDAAVLQVEPSLAPLLWRRTPGFAALR
jgi:hypothetical protein